MTKHRISRSTGLLLALLLAVSGMVLGSAPVAAAAAEMPTADNGAPRTLPVLTSWDDRPGRGYQFRRQLAVVPTDAALGDAAATLAEDLGAALGAPVRVSDRRPRIGDIVLALDPSRAGELGTEGYAATVDRYITITAADPRGVFLGTRSVAQWAAQAGLGRYVPTGSTVDKPAYPERGVGICACQIQVSVESIQAAMQDAAYLKANQFWIETKVTSQAYPKANFWGYFTPDEARRISATAKKYGLTLIPEVNSPGHMRPWLFNYPELQLVDRFGNRQPDRLDITKPEAYTMITELIDEYLAVIDTPYWHMGADEYMLGSAYPNFPQMEAYAKQQWGPDAVANDVFIDFINKINAYVRSKGKTLRIWNDGVPERWGTQRLDTDIVIEHWESIGAKPQDLLEAGHDVQNSSYALYGVRGGYLSDPRELWDSGFDVEAMRGQRVDDAGTPGKVRGAKITIWPDNGAGNTENQMWVRMLPALRLMAQTTWGGAERPVDSYPEFAALGEGVGRAPVLTDATSTAIDDGGYAITANGQRLGGTSPVRMGSARTSWRLTRTDDGYYTVANGTRCLDIVGAGTTTWLGVPLDSGVRAEARACDASRNLQKWYLREGSGGGIVLTNAITRLPLHVAGDKTLQQAPPDRIRPTSFTLVAE